MDKNILINLARFKEQPIEEDLKIELEGNLNKLIYRINEATTDKAVRENIETLELVENWIERTTAKHDIEFPDLVAFIEGYKGSSTVSQSIKETSTLPTAMLKSLASRHSENSVIKINSKLNFSQIKLVTKEIFEEHNNQPLVFSIPRTHSIPGKIIGEISQRKVKIPVAWKIKIKTKEDEYFIPYLFGERIPPRSNIVDEVSGEFYLYRFLSKDNAEYAVVSTDELKLDDYTLEGLSIDVEDIKIIGDAHKLINKYAVFFVHTATSHIIEIKNHDQLFTKVSKLKLTGNKLYQYICSHKIGENKVQILEHPKWFVKLTSAFLFHRKKGKICPYPMHILWIADRGTGKTTYMESLHQKSGEIQEIIAGSTSTVKYLVPSFKETNKPEMGALAKSSRLCFVDEFFRIVRVNNKDKEDECGRMNDLLEHKDRMAGSGQGRIRTTMTARLLASTNPIAGTNNIVNLVDKFDDAFLSRFMIYYQTDEHIKLINQKKKEGDVFIKDWIPVNEFLSVQDYLQSFDAVYDFPRLVELFDKFTSFLGETVIGMYEARYLHHMECLMDGIIKTRCLSTRDKSFTATEEDYQDLELIWSTMIKGWFKQNIDEILRNDSLPIETREKFLPEEALFILRKLAKTGYKVKPGELKEKCRMEMHPSKLNFYLSLLHQGDFIKERDGYIVHYQWEASE
ncbi:hypothetical protein K9M74_03660 [Candidatus Woesearchaeota archaeon]|nr:hypothetical protein [Candidatus Woesearchaeota archaeon]MCF7859216.1 hypothetical protein [Candidatus Cloacimonadota bacterium]MCF8012763.1 hypothetical protein [Candidatus Woesearchaeota archaeon]